MRISTTHLLILIFATFLMAKPASLSTWTMSIHDISDSSKSSVELSKNARFIPFSPTNFPQDIANGTKIIVLRSSFDWNRVEAPTIQISPSDHPFKILINDQELFRFGIFSNPYVAVNYKSQIVSIPLNIITQKNNVVTMILYPRGERTPPPTIIVDSYPENSEREFWQTLTYYTFVCGFWIIGIFLSILFFALWFASKTEKKQYLFFALTSLTIALGYTNVVFAAPLHNEPILWIISRSSLVAAAALLMTFASIKAETDQTFKWVNRFFLFIAVVFFFNVLLMETKYEINKAYNWATSFVITPALLLTLLHALIKLARSRTPIDFCVVVGVLVTFATAFIDLYYVKNFKLPYCWTLVYGYSFLEIAIVFSLAQDLWKLFLADRSKATQLQRVNSELLMQTSKLEHVSESKTRFLRNMAHEFKTPLQGIVTIADLLHKNETNTIALTEIMELLNLQMQKHLYNIQNVMDLSLFEDRTPEINFHEFETSAFLMNIENMFKNNEQNRLNTLHLIHGANLPEHLYGDHEHISRIAFNILTNMTSGNEPATINCFVNWLSNTDMIEFRMSNTISHIPNETIEILSGNTNSLLSKFGENSTVDDIALYVAAQLIPLIEGSVSCQESFGQIIISFPLKQVQPQHHFQKKSDKIMIAEDNPVNRMLIQKLLEKLGYLVITAEDGLEAVEKVESDSPALILMDVQMPYMNGIEATRKIRDTDTSVIIIALTANASRKECIEAGMNDFLSKPANMKELKKVIEQYLAN